jgi:hypothetical protein
MRERQAKLTSGFEDGKNKGTVDDSMEEDEWTRKTLYYCKTMLM